MPDLRTEMLKTIKVWNEEGIVNNKPQTQEVTFNERLFEWVKSHPNISASDARKAFPKYPDNVVSTTLKKMCDCGMLARDERNLTPYPGFGRKTYFVYRAVEAKYRPIGGSKPFKKAKPSKPSNVLKIISPPPRVEIPMFDAQRILDGLSVTQAKELYVLLRGIFK